MKVLIGLLVAGAVIALAFFIFRGIRETTATASAVHDGVLAPYLEFLKQEKFEDADEQPCKILEILGSEGSSDALRPGIW